MKIYKVKQQSDKWFALKLGKFSASSAQAIATAGKGLDTIVYQKVAEKLSGKRESTYSNPDMERGNKQEDIARSSYEMETGNKVKQVGFCELNEYVGASPDGLIGKDGLVEIKCQRNSNYIRSRYTKKIDTGYLWQMQMQMYVTDRKWCDFVVFNENFPNLLITRVNRDEKIIEKIKNGLDKGIKLFKEVIK